VTSYSTEVVLGNKYRDTQTGIEGTAIAVTFWQHSCERVIIETVSAHDGKLEEYTFDSPRLELVSPPAKEYKKPANGGPGGSAFGRGVSGRQASR
jgi:hypothetical protein